MGRLRSALLWWASALVTVSATNEAGLRFLEENKGKEGVTILPSGLQYKVLRYGHGDSHPMVDSECDVHYELRTAQNHPSGDTIDSSYARGTPTSFAPNQVIKGWTEAMQLMVEGDKWEVYLPSELGYGDRGRPPIIGGGDCLVFTMEIIKINGGKIYFEGAKGKERKVRAELSNGYVQHYEGPKGDERLVRAELPDGSVLDYLGVKGDERKVRGKLSDGSVMHLEGAKDEERMVRIERPDGTVEHYEGPRSDTRLVRTEYPDGSVRGVDHDEV
jgi:FKBP-type peptidyl-prolyl cis-trans isomerase FklB